MNSEQSFPSDFIAAALQAQLAVPIQHLAGAPEGFTSITTDSRKVRPGCLFVALKGEKFDGHDFIAQALQQGVAGVVCRKDWALQSPAGNTPAKVWIYRVEDTEVAYRQLGAAWRQRFSLPLIAVSGSVGKTTTKELLAAILSGKWKNVLKTSGSQNGFIGIPMTLLELRAPHEAAVIEVGIDEIGAMKKHIDLVAPNAAILTSIGPEHLEKLRDLQTVAHEESLALLEVSQTGGAVAINLDDPWISPLAERLASGKGRKLSYSLTGKQPPDNIPCLHGRLKADLSSLQVEGDGFNGETFPLPLPGMHNCLNLLGAIAAARLLGLTPAEIQTGLKTFGGVGGRSEIRKLPDGITVVCDYYNANPSSVEAGLELLNQMAQATKQNALHHARWACLGDMLELGHDEEQFHRGLARKILSLSLENVFLYGPRMCALFAELQAHAFKGRLEHFESHAQLASALIAGVQPGDAVLIKGSRGMKMEEVWKPFEAHHASKSTSASS